MHDDLIAELVSSILAKGYSVEFSQNMREDGLFFPAKKSIRVKKNDMMPFNLLHEYCHLLQWEESAAKFTPCYNSLLIIEKWLRGQYFTNKEVSKAFNYAIMMESDCESRVTKILDEKSIPKDNYIRIANLRLAAFFYAKDNRKWKGYSLNQKHIDESPTSIIRFKKDFPKQLKKTLDKYYETS